MKLVDFVCFEATRIGLESTDRNKVIKQLVTSLDDAGKLGENNAEKLIRSIIKRENEASTGLGKGVAVPHINNVPIEEPVAVFGLSREGVDFKSLDEQPVYSIILLVSPANEPEKHHQAMQCIVSHLQKDQFRNFLKQADSKDYIEDLFKEADDNPEL
jgi:mannitol/fructose-specific phosphotransferase system IIA component (Ntr-type)